MLKHILIWLFLAITIISMEPIVMTREKMAEHIRQDYGDAVAMLGETDALDHGLKQVYRGSLDLLAGFSDEFDEDAPPPATAKGKAKAADVLSRIPPRWVEMIKLQAYAISLRLVTLGVASPWLFGPIPLVLLAGYFGRKLKKELLEPVSPPLYNTSLHLQMVLLGVLMIWVLAPIPLSLQFIPLVSAGLFVALFQAMNNYPS